MIKEVIHDPILLAKKSEKATIEDLSGAWEFEQLAVKQGKRVIKLAKK